MPALQGEVGRTQAQMGMWGGGWFSSGSSRSWEGWKEGRAHDRR